MREVLLPVLGESVIEATVTRWLKSEGDAVALDEPLLEVSTDKVDTEVPSPIAGVLSKVLVSEGQTVPNGTVLCYVSEHGKATEDVPNAVPSLGDPAPKDQDTQRDTTVQTVPSSGTQAPFETDPKPINTTPTVSPAKIEHSPDLQPANTSETQTPKTTQHTSSSSVSLSSSSNYYVSTSLSSDRQQIETHFSPSLSYVPEGLVSIVVNTDSKDILSEVIYQICFAADDTFGPEPARSVSLLRHENGKTVSLRLPAVGDLRPEATGNLVRQAISADPRQQDPDMLRPSFIGVYKETSPAVMSAAPLYGHAIMATVSFMEETLVSSRVLNRVSVTLRYDSQKVSTTQASNLAGRLFDRMQNSRQSS